MKVKKGDTVKILSGKDRGKTGKILSVLRDEGRIIVEKINIVKKHRKQTGNSAERNEGGIIEVESPISVSKVMIVCPSCSKPARIGYKINKDKKVRICKKCSSTL